MSRERRPREQSFSMCVIIPSLNPIYSEHGLSCSQISNELFAHYLRHLISSLVVEALSLRLDLFRLFHETVSFVQVVTWEDGLAVTFGVGPRAQLGRGMFERHLCRRSSAVMVLL